jgi:hypothetical protein
LHVHDSFLLFSKSITSSLTSCELAQKKEAGTMDTSRKGISFRLIPQVVSQLVDRDSAGIRNSVISQLANPRIGSIDCLGNLTELAVVLWQFAKYVLVICHGAQMLANF